MSISASATRLPGGGADAVDIQISARSLEGTLDIEEVFVLDNLGATVLYESIPDCGATYETTISISPRHLPLTIRVTECVSGRPHDFPGQVPPDPGVRPCDPADTSPPPPGCTTAQDELRMLIENVNRLCGILLGLEAQIDSLRRIVGIMVASAAALAIAAAIAAAIPVIGSGIAAGLAAFAALLAAGALAIGVYLATLMFQRSEYRRGLHDTYTEFNRVAGIVRRLCCPHEISVDLTPPDCPVPR